MLGFGKINTTYKIKIKHPYGTEFEAVFKPLQREELNPMAIFSGIDRKNPQTAMRNLATSAYAKQLNFDVIPKTQLAILSEPDKWPSGKPTLGLVMERAKGNAASRVSPDIFQNPQVARELTKLQLLDHLTGETDRHFDSYFIHVDNNNHAKVTGIDNDQSFGQNLMQPTIINFIPIDPPPVIDSAMAESINSLTDNNLEAMLKDRLNAFEIEAAKSRLNSMKDHIKDNKNTLIISPEDWNGKTAEMLEQKYSYFRFAKSHAEYHSPAAIKLRCNQRVW